MSLIRIYLKDRYRIVAGYAVIVMIFLAVSALYHLDNLPLIGYAAVMIGFLGLCAGIYDFWQYRKHLKALRGLSFNYDEPINYIPESLPAAVDALQLEYQKRLREMYELYQQSQAAGRRNEAERLDYYMMWAHQIKTPIAAMKLLIQNQQVPNQQGGFALERELFKVEAYVEMVLHYLRLDSIDADMLLQRCPVQTMVRTAVKKYALLFIDGKIKLALAEFAWSVITDEKWFSFILEQIISNAIKYTPAGTISIYAEERRLIIADTGIGIRAEDLPRVYERGFTGYNGRMDQKATGIGLYLSKQVADRLGIGIEITSQSGRGTQVSLNLADLVKM